MDRTRHSIGVSGFVALATTGLVALSFATFAPISETTTRQIVGWLAFAGTMATGVYLYAYVFADENRSPTAQQYTWVGLPTSVTLFRGTIIAWVGGVVAVAVLGTTVALWAWAAALGYGFAGALDAVDGAIARRTNRVTVLGERLDMTVDAFGLVAAPVAGIVLGQLPWWYLSVSAARYVFVVGLAIRNRTGKPTFDLPPRASRRVLAGLQMAFVPVALVPGVIDAWIPSMAALAAGGLLLGFGRDWLYVTGRLGETEAWAASTPVEE